MTGETTTPVLEAIGLVKTYVMPHKRVDVLRGASLATAPGELAAVVGKSGAGKSTLLNVLGGIDAPEAGEVRICGESLFALPPSKRTALRASTIGFVFQSYHLLPEMTILENVMLPAMALGRLSRNEMRRRAADLLAQVGLDGRAAHRPLELSGGEQQRAAIARALMNAPRLILADEPTGNLDQATGKLVLDLLFSLVRSSGSSMLIVTHDPGVAARCDRTLALESGAFVNNAAADAAGGAPQP